MQYTSDHYAVVICPLKIARSAVILQGACPLIEVHVVQVVHIMVQLTPRSTGSSIST
jgi:hypothetical protein